MYVCVYDSVCELVYSLLLWVLMPNYVFLTLRRHVFGAATSRHALPAWRRAGKGNLGGLDQVISV